MTRANFPAGHAPGEGERIALGRRVERADQRRPSGSARRRGRARRFPPLHSSENFFSSLARRGWRRTVPVSERNDRLGLDHSPRKRTPRTRSPLVTPVAATTVSALAQVHQVVLPLRVLDAHTPARASTLASVSSTRRPCIWPPTQRSAPAASTPSGAAPMPR